MKRRSAWGEDAHLLYSDTIDRVGRDGRNACEIYPHSRCKRDPAPPRSARVSAPPEHLHFDTCERLPTLSAVTLLAGNRDGKT
jgi:hypothetical protein